MVTKEPNGSIGFFPFPLLQCRKGRKGRKRGDFDFRRRFRCPLSSPASSMASEREGGWGIDVRLYID